MTHYEIDQVIPSTEIRPGHLILTDWNGTIAEVTRTHPTAGNIALITANKTVIVGSTGHVRIYRKAT